MGDWNGDGRLDLLVGDFSMSFGEEPKLTQTDKSRKKELQRKLEQVEKELEPYYQEAAKLAEKAKSATPKGRAALEKEEANLEVKYKKTLDEQGTICTEMRKFERPMHYHGYVWVYLRKPVEAAAKP